MAETEADEGALTEELNRTTEVLVNAGDIDPVYRGLLSNGGANDVGAVQAHADSELQQVLLQLEREPQTDDACAAKFQLYEGYATTVSTARRATIDLWIEVQGEFDEHPSVRAAIERDIKSIDREQNLGVPDTGRFWFVHGMVEVASSNSAMIERILASTRTKLELLSTQTECPVCLEPFDNGEQQHGPTTLGCAHKVCHDCWTHWSALKGQHAFCPLCRFDDFLSHVLDEAS